MCICLGAFVILAWAFIPPAISSPEHSFRIEPEYDRFLQRVVFSLETSTKDLSLHEDIIRSLPEYSEVLMLLPEKRAQDIGRQLEALGLRQKVRLMAFSSRVVGKEEAYRLYTRHAELRKLKKRHFMPRGSVWAQDLFEVGRDEDGTSAILAPFIHKWFVKPDAQWGQRLESDNVFVEKLASGGIEFKKLPLVFKGGNVLVDKLGGRSIAFAGGDVIRDTQLVLEATLGKKVSSAEVVEGLKLYLNVDRVKVIGRQTSQPVKMFHLDQAMVLLPGGVAAVTRIVDYELASASREVDEVRCLLGELRAELRALGYTIVDIAATVEDVENFRYYVNGVPYVNKSTGKREFLMPLFKASFEGDNWELFRSNISSIESLGYMVIPVYTRANERRGGIHCIVNVIS
ncbi:MAG: agmatine deiminase family protein [Thermodesulfovibrionales bacterium]|nr:agmatine deiminase family protein [Thermodesulfovibrionales bacterium]